MSESQVVLLIREFSEAHVAAAPNAGLMCNRPSAKAADECAERMRRVRKADEAIYALTDARELPAVLVSFLDAETDKGCAHCWISARREKNHPECNDKIDRWFAARDALIRYGQSDESNI